MVQAKLLGGSGTKPHNFAIDNTTFLLSQTAANSEDTYKVRVVNNVYRTYDADENGTGPVAGC